MDPIFGILMIAIGLFMVVSAGMKSEFFIYQLMVARSKILWGENVYRFHQVVGGLIIVVGILVVLDVIW